MNEIKQIENNKKTNLANIMIIAVCVIFMLAIMVIRFNIIDKRAFDETIFIYLSLVAVFSLCFTVVLFALKHLNTVRYTVKVFGLICFVISITYAICIFIEKLSPYAMPVTLAVLLLSVFTDTKVAFLGNVFCVLMLYITLMSLAISGGQQMPYWLLPMMIFAVTAGTILSITVNRDTRRLTFIFFGILINTACLPLLIINELITQFSFSELINVLPYAPSLIFGSVLFALMLQPIIEVAFNVNSNFRLMELCDHHRPLLLRLAKSAPGTFNHSLTVANLAETCARAINENTYFARAAAYYHDVGKLKNTRYFKENQFNEANPHDGLTPEVSCDIIRKHASQGADICKEYRIPQEIAVITAEHHGTMPIAYFYNKAKEITDREVDIKDYRYFGPIPTSKVAAIIMICDAAEATVRAMKEHDYEKVEKIVKDIIDQRLRYGQFDNCDITLKDLATIKDTIVSAFGGLYHERIQYPEV